MIFHKSYSIRRYDQLFDIVALLSRVPDGFRSNAMFSRLNHNNSCRVAIAFPEGAKVNILGTRIVFGIHGRRLAKFIVKVPQTVLALGVLTVLGRGALKGFAKRSRCRGAFSIVKIDTL